ncbi:MAG: hypothetical protein F6K09_12845, partial [Merismopedia sp. SIO2A8]|nr:hypothetical protein [Merismopedia sp. SIO2A8]
MSVSTSSLIFTHRLQPLSGYHHAEQSQNVSSALVLALTADERTKVRQYFEAEAIQTNETLNSLDWELGQGDKTIVQPQTRGVYLRLSRGTVLAHGDRLTTDDHSAILSIR